MSYQLTITFGGHCIVASDRPTNTFTFNTDGERNAYINGVDKATECFPDDAYISDEDLKALNMTQEELVAFNDGMDAGDGWSDYKLDELTEKESSMVIQKTDSGVKDGTLKLAVRDSSGLGQMVLGFTLFMESEDGTERNFLGDAVLANFHKNMYEVTSICARSGFGKLFLNLLSQYCGHYNRYLTTTRDGCSETALLTRFKEVLEHNEVESVDVPDEHCDECNRYLLTGDIDYDYFERKAYRLPATKQLTTALVKDNGDFPNEWEDYFRTCYEAHSSKVLDNIAPLTLRVAFEVQS